MIVESVAVLLTCHNRKEKTISCLETFFSIIQNSTFDLGFDVFLVDDGSSDGTSEEVQKRFQNVIIIKGNGHLFWNRGMNLAWSVSSQNDYNYYLWLNDDTTMKPNAIEVLMNHSKAFSDNAIICGINESAKSREITYGGYQIDTHELIIPNGKPQWCYFFNGNLVLIPRNVFKVLGNLDSTFHHSLGDYDYGLRAYKNDINTYVTAESIAYCERNELPRWCNPKYSFIQRLKIFYSPLGAVPFQHFIFVSRHYGYGKAFRKLFSNHLRLFFPSLWIISKGKLQYK